MERKNKNEPTHKVVFKKLGMSEYFDKETAQLIPVTILEYQPMQVFKKGTYYSLAFVPNIGAKLTKSNQGQLIANDIMEVKKGFFMQLKGKLLDLENDFVSLKNFNIGDKVDVQGTTKGKGFSGVMKRYNFKGGRASHGTSLCHRTMGSVGSQDIGHVWKGKKMPGRHGNSTITTHNLIIKSMDLANNIIAVKGSVPGVNNGVVYMRHAIKQFDNQNPWHKNELALADLKGGNSNVAK